MPPNLVPAASASIDDGPAWATLSKEDQMLLGKHPLTLDHVIGASIFNESKEDRAARGKAECTSAAV